jgi:hypothetical protein
MTEDTGDVQAREERAESLKERVYITFTALAVVIALRSHDATADRAVVTLLITVIGALLAVFVADVVSHIAVHTALPAGVELRRMAQVTFGASTILIVPLVALLLAVADIWRVEPALRVATIVLVSSLIAIGYAAARRVRLPGWQRIVVLFAEFLLGAVVVSLELLAHGL